MRQTSNQPLDYLDLIPDDLYHRLVTHRLISHRFGADSTLTNQHNLQLRCLSVLAIRDYLLNSDDNVLSILQSWLDANLASWLYKKISSPQLLSKTRHNPSYTDEVILSILDWLDQPESDFMTQYQKNKPHHKQENRPALADNELMQPQPPGIDAGHRAQPQSGDVSTESSLSSAFSNFIDKQSQQDYLSMQSLNKRFALQRQLGWDLKKGIKNEMDIKYLLKFHKVIKNSKHLQSIIRIIGRNKLSYLDELATPGMHQKAHNGTSFNESVPNEHSINSVTGVYNGDDIGRMLPLELASLGHPKLKMLWHARRADQQLLNYHFQGVNSDHIADIQAKKISHEQSGKQAVRQQGPMILCVDTSASMKGKAEAIAKAVVLEAMRVARIEKRRCYVFSFSGNNEVNELEFDLMSSGWQPVIDFLKFSFYGGTDVNAVLLKAFNKLAQNNWSKADIVLISDGRFKIDKSVIAYMKSLDSASRVFGIQVSQWNSLAFGDICHQTFTLNNV